MYCFMLRADTHLQTYLTSTMYNVVIYIMTPLAAPFLETEAMPTARFV